MLSVSIDQNLCPDVSMGPTDPFLAVQDSDPNSLEWSYNHSITSNLSLQEESMPTPELQYTPPYQFGLQVEPVINHVVPGHQNLIPCAEPPTSIHRSGSAYSDNPSEIVQNGCFDGSLTVGIGGHGQQFHNQGYYNPGFINSRPPTACMPPSLKFNLSHSFTQNNNSPVGHNAAYDLFPDSGKDHYYSPYEQSEIRNTTQAQCVNTPTALSAYGPPPGPPPTIPLPTSHSSYHQPVAEYHRSSYSELSANVEYLSKTASTTPRSLTRRLPQSSLHTHSGQNPHSGHRKLPANRAPLAWKPKEMREQEANLSSESDDLDSEPPTPPADLGLDMRSKFSLRTASRKAQETKKSPSLACYFCRERKIACGRPEEGNPNQTCNQCARRSFTCDYPKESLRGQHKRGRKKTNNREYHVSIATSEQHDLL